METRHGQHREAHRQPAGRAHGLHRRPGRIGHLRSDIRPGLRILGFERRLTIAFVVGTETVTILRVFAAGRNWEETF